MRAAFDSSCWITLGLSDYLEYPETGWMFTTPNCTEGQSGANCCDPDQPWSTCYLRLAHGYPGQDCSEINPQSCTWDSTLAVDPSIAAQVRYVTRNIYNVNNFFSTWWEALQFATTQAATIVHSVVAELDPVEKSHFTLYNVLIGLTFGLCFIPYLGPVGVSLMASNIGASFTIAIQEAPMVARAIWPTKTEDSQLIQIGQIDSEIGNINKEIGAMLNSALELLMRDIPTFVSFVEDGHFSDDSYISLPKTAAGLDMALKTFVTSTAMSKNGWVAYPLLYYSRDEIPGFGLCTFGPENYDICSRPDNIGISYFYSNISGNAYQLMHGAANTSALLHRIVRDDWSTLVALFDGAFNCTSSGNAASDQPFSIKVDGTIDLSCVSQLSLCGGCSDDVCMVPMIDGKCPMPNCPICD